MSVADTVLLQQQTSGTCDDTKKRSSAAMISKNHRLQSVVKLLDKVQSSSAHLVNPRVAQVHSKVASKCTSLC